MPSGLDRDGSAGWKHTLAAAIRDPDVLIDELRLDESLKPAARRAARLFPLLVPRSYLARIERGNPCDPLLQQVLPIDAEFDAPSGFQRDPLDESAARQASGLLQKYAGRTLLIAAGACAVHCRYCFRRHYPYDEEPGSLDEFEPAFQALAADASIHEVILSGGDPLVLSDGRLEALCRKLESIPQLHRLRIHTRLPIVLPERVTPSLLTLLRGLRLTPIVVVHANHARELVDDCEAALRKLVRGGLTVLNQAVLLRGVNDTVHAQVELCERLADLGVLPYYLHQLDRVQGAAHFEVPVEQGREIIRELRRRLPGYAVPQYVQEVPGADHKVPLG